jgi:hypothetical protein
MNKLVEGGVTASCSNCKQEGHYLTHCPERDPRAEPWRAPIWRGTW